MSSIARIVRVTAVTRNAQFFQLFVGVCFLSGCSKPEQSDDQNAANASAEFSGLTSQQTTTVSKQFVTEGIDASPVVVSGEIGPKAWVIRRTKWNNPNIGVCWESSANGFATEQQWIKEVLQRGWMDASAINFVGFAACPDGRFDGIRVAATPYEAETIGTGNELAGVKNGLRLNFLFVNWNSSKCSGNDKVRKSCIQETSAHEFGHALGFVHEHNQHDSLRPSDCKPDRQPQIGDLILTKWDLESVMNYCRPNALMREGELSKYDRQSAEQFYGNEI